MWKRELRSDTCTAPAAEKVKSEAMFSALRSADSARKAAKR